MRRMAPVALAVLAVFTLAQARVGREVRPEASAIGALRAIVTGQQVYASTNGGYAPSLLAVATPCSVGERGFVSPNLGAAPPIVGPYEIRLEPQGDRSSRDRD